VLPVGGQPRRFDAQLHRSAGALVLELEPAAGPGALGRATDLATLVQQATARFTACASVQALCDTLVDVVRGLGGHDRVMVYRFDADGHGQVVAEQCSPGQQPFLGHCYPATDIPQIARALYLKARVRVLADLEDAPVPLLPALRPDSRQPLDMSLCHLRTMSPMHLQYLRNMGGVRATLTASLVRDGQLWGLVACHHATPRPVPLALRLALALLSEVASTRLAAIENYAQAQVALLVRRMEQRLIDATSSDGDWRVALMRNPRALLQPLEAGGAALVHQGEVQTTGAAPTPAEVRALVAWLDGQLPAGPETCWAHSALARANPALASLVPSACGVLAVRLSATGSDWLMWFRPEQLQTITWAGNPAKPMEGLDPLQLTPRRSFEAWAELVRGTARPWGHPERVMARSIGSALSDLIVQVHAVRMLIAERQLAQIRATVGAATEPVLLAGGNGQLLFANAAFEALSGRSARPGAASPLQLGEPLAGLFHDPARVQRIVDGLDLQPWRGEWALVLPEGGTRPVAVRAEQVPGRDGSPLGVIVTLDDLLPMRESALARQQLEQALASTARARGADEAIAALLGNARLAAQDVADGHGGPSVAPLLRELEQSARRATALYQQLRGWAGKREGS
jgi:two-component system, chemotaxis family, sensor kinase Cph1